MFANGLGWPHLLILALVFMLLFGAKRLPEAASSLGKSLKVFKKEVNDLTHDARPAVDQTPAQPVTAAPATPQEPARDQTR